MLILDVLAVKPFALSHFGALACSGALIVLGSGVLATAYATNHAAGHQNLCASHDVQ